MKKEEKEILLKKKLIEMKKYEQELYDTGMKFIAGVDEVGRGPLAGPVVAAAVILPKDFNVLGVDDSKKLSEKKRNELFDVIKKAAVAYGIGQVENAVIDEINILEATRKAMSIAVENANRMLLEKFKTEERGCQNIKRDEANLYNAGESNLSNRIEHILFDAIEIKELSISQTSIIKGDAKSVSIAAASILAKVTRDSLMVEYSLKYPYYAFESNKGYGTKSHYEGIEKMGICPIHRRSFLKKILCK